MKRTRRKQKIKNEGRAKKKQRKDNLQEVKIKKIAVFFEKEKRCDESNIGKSEKESLALDTDELAKEFLTFSKQKRAEIINRLISLKTNNRQIAENCIELLYKFISIDLDSDIKRGILKVYYDYISAAKGNTLVYPLAGLPKAEGQHLHYYIEELYELDRGVFLDYSSSKLTFLHCVVILIEKALLCAKKGKGGTFIELIKKLLKLQGGLKNISHSGGGKPIDLLNKISERVGNFYEDTVGITTRYCRELKALCINSEVPQPKGSSSQPVIRQQLQPPQPKGLSSQPVIRQQLQPPQPKGSSSHQVVRQQLQPPLIVYKTDFRLFKPLILEKCAPTKPVTPLSEATNLLLNLRRIPQSS